MHKKKQSEADKAFMAKAATIGIKTSKGGSGGCLVHGPGPCPKVELLSVCVHRVRAQRKTTNDDEQGFAA